MINVAGLTKEIEAAGITTGGCNSNGVVWAADGMTEIQMRADVAAIIAAHNPAVYEQAEATRKARRANAQAEAKLAAQLRSLTPQQAVDYIETNVTNLASAKTVIKIMARMLIAMRDEIWPEMSE